MAAEISESLKRVEERIGRSRRRHFTVILTPHRREFARIYQAFVGRRPKSWIAGVAFPARDLLLVSGDSLWFLKKPTDRPPAVLEHELAHLVIHARKESRIPRWFDEGVAMWASRKFLDPEDEAFLSGLARIGALHSLESLDREIPGNHNLASIAYQESFLVVQWLVRTFGAPVIEDLLRRMEEGKTFPEALEQQTGLTVPELEGRFIRWLKASRSLWEFAASIVNLWTVVSLLALVAIFRLVIRKRRLLRQMEERERREL